MESTSVQFTLNDDDDDDDEYHGHFAGCTSLAAISVPDPDHAMATWPHGAMFVDCIQQLPELLAAATPGMQLRYYWKPGAVGHKLCLPNTREAVLTVLFVAARLMHRWRASAHSARGNREREQLCQRVPPHVHRTVLPDLPDELWFCILGLIRCHELGGATA